MPAEAFRRLTGHAPDGVWAAPGRVNLIGEHTDYNDGYVLPFAIALSVRVAARRRGDRAVRVWSHQEGGLVTADLDEVAPGAVVGWSAYVLGALALLAAEAGTSTCGLDVLVDGDLPRGAGLSSSAALTCAALLAARDLWDVDLGGMDLVRLAQRAETEFAGVPVGVMDQIACLLGADGRALLVDTRELSVQPVPLEPAAAGLRLLVVDTGVARQLVTGAYAERRQACERAARALGVPALRDVTVQQLSTDGGRLDEVLLRRARHVVTDNARTIAAAELLRDGRLAEVGPLLAASHASLRDDFEVSCPAADAVVEAARQGGALGARITGAGFGGCVLVLCPATAVDEVGRSVVTRAARDGHPPPDVFAVRPSAGARRLS